MKPFIARPQIEICKNDPSCYPSKASIFWVNYTQGCEGLQVKFYLMFDKSVGRFNQGLSDSQWVGYDDKTFTKDVVTGPSLTYDDKGIYFLTVNPGNDQSPEKTDTVQIQVFKDNSPQYHILNCESNSVGVRIESAHDDFHKYWVQFDQGGIITDTIFEKQGDSTILSPIKFGTEDITVRVKGIYKYGDTLSCPFSPDTNISPINSIPQGKIDSLILKDDFAHLYVSSSSSTFNASYYLINNLGQEMYLSRLREIVIPNANEQDCFTLKAFNSCRGNVDKVYNRVCGIEILGEAKDRVNQISWGSDWHDNTTTYLNGNIMGNDSRFVLDSSVICSKNYDYFVQLDSAGTISRSKLITLQAISDEQPPFQATVSATFNQNVLSVSWDHHQIINYNPINYFLYSNGFQIDQGQFSLFELPNWDLGSCYYVDYNNECGRMKSSFSNKVCPIYLTSQKIKKNHVQLNWTSYQGQAVREYYVEKLDMFGNRIDLIGPVKGLEYQDGSQNIDDPDITRDFHTINYRIIANFKNGMNVFSNSQMFSFESAIYFPNVFDGNNTTGFGPIGRYSSFEMNIYNRWGTLIYSDQNRNWMGQFQGQSLNSGVYFYIAEVKDFRGEKFVRQGTVTLIK